MGGAPDFGQPHIQTGVSQETQYEFFASCLSGLERMLADELRAMGIARVRPLGGGVAFFCTAALAYRACLWSRLASRVLLVVARVNAGDADLLYAGAYDIAWEDVVSADAAFSVRASGTNEQLRNTRFTALKVKDAIADRMRTRRPSVGVGRENASRASIDVRVRGNRATISLDFSGEALNRRSYLAEEDAKEAPLKCVLAAAALYLCGWPEAAQQGAAFADPACRDGVLLVEAVSMACDAAPGLAREKWGFEAWGGYDDAVWRNMRDRAEGRFKAGLAQAAGVVEGSGKPSRPEAGKMRFAGASSSSPFVSRARDHVRRAGLRSVASVEFGDASSAAQLAERLCANAQRAGGGFSTSTCFVGSDIDAQARLDAPASVRADEAAFVSACAAAAHAATEDAFPRFVVLAPHDLQGRFGCAPEARVVFGRDRTETAVEVYDRQPAGCISLEVADSHGGAPHHVEVLEAASEQFAARLRKVFKERRKWAAREGVSCYRLYDADLPDYAVAIDWYAGAGDARGNNYLHISEYAPPASVDPEKAQRRFDDVLALAPVICSIRPDHVFSKRRLREKGGGQYRHAGLRSYRTTVEENGYLFEVDLAARLDTGLFLDHRITRELVGAHASGARFLNLFAYTGTASVYAAGGGASATTTVDLSQTYLDWARRNMAANGFGDSGHAFEKADVLRWVVEARRARKRYDLVFVDPPTFSNSKAMGKKTWDVQRDHVELLIGVAHLLAEGGRALFSCNLRSFKPDVEALARYGVVIEDISQKTIPFDFARTPRIHHCYWVARENSARH